MVTFPIDTFADAFFDNSLFEKGDHRFIELALNVFTRDNFTCQVCNFHCEPSDSVKSAYFQICAKDGNYRNLKLNNLYCICPFCHAPKNIRASVASGKYTAIGNIIEVSQTEISILCKALFSEKADRSNHLYAYADSIDTDLNALSQIIAQIKPKTTTRHLVSTTSSADGSAKVIQMFLQNICYMSDPKSAQIKELFKHITLYPRYTAFVNESKYWNEMVYSTARLDASLNDFLNRM